jgi:hypothetical protein
MFVMRRDDQTRITHSKGCCERVLDLSPGNLQANSPKQGAIALESAKDAEPNTARV